MIHLLCASKSRLVPAASKEGFSVTVDKSPKVYTQLAREGVMLTQDGDTELSLVLSSRRVAARGDSCKEAIGEINLPFLPLSVPLYLIHKSLIDTWNSLI